MSATLETYDLMVLTIEFTDKSGVKTRPALVLDVDSEKISYFRITTKYETKSDFMKSKYFEIENYEKAGLFKKSYIDTFKPYAINKSDFNIKQIGHLSVDDIEKLTEFIKNNHDRTPCDS